MVYFSWQYFVSSGGGRKSGVEYWRTAVRGLMYWTEIRLYNTRKEPLIDGACILRLLLKSESRCEEGAVWENCVSYGYCMRSAGALCLRTTSDYELGLFQVRGLILCVITRYHKHRYLIASIWDDADTPELKKPTKNLRSRKIRPSQKSVNRRLHIV